VSNGFKGIVQGSFNILAKESYYSAMGYDMAQAGWVKHGTGVRSLRPIDG